MTTTATTAYADLRLVIGTETISADQRESLPVHDPATGETIGRVPIATDDDLRRALESTARGFARWRATPAYDRAAILRDAAR
ncbi:MAG: NAD-dependent succinate-semialdehyde dehydrogenase, partial [Candidatus Eremiobacteraeota bacterium]|nr:NAD-dependent succinate-semialdehyde dehydrogenase [Candidatus Eremiobacteraeota bacterium]